MVVLEKGEPVRIELVNDTRAPTAIHWHGIELDRSYADGVVGWSGRGGVVAPPASPGGTFVAEFTPPRAGTFIYHSHTNELLQISSGLYGALIVEDPARPFDPETEPVVILGGNGWVDFEQGRVNGSTTPVPIMMEVGRTYRLRLININPDWRAWIRLKRGEDQLVWRAIAKDGFDLPAGQAVVRTAAIEMGPGETADFEVTPDAPGDLVLEIVSFDEIWTVIQPIHVR
jgi:FtsP/CotA-like multicopper oxidase with cupredoxin domain